MMTKVLLTQVVHKQIAAAADKLQHLPPFLQEHIMQKREPYLQLQSLAGYLLLRQLLTYYIDGASHMLQHLHFTPAGRPLLPGSLFCSITHSKEIVGATISAAPVGLDVEYMQAVSVDLYNDHFSYKEIQMMKAQPDQLTTFYRLWTRKESVIKASGLGFEKALASVEVLGEAVDLDNIRYHFLEIPVVPQYLCSMAQAADPGQVHVAFDLFERL